MIENVKTLIRHDLELQDEEVLNTSSTVSARRLFLSLAGLTVVVFFLMGIGATVRNMGAGLSCPDWPLCYGKLIPPMDPQIFIEWFHRLIASAVSFGLLAITFGIMRKPVFRKSLGKLNIIALGLLMAQVILGGLTVIGLLKYEIVTSHLAVGFLFFGTLLWMALKARSLSLGNHEIKALDLTDVEKKKVIKFSKFSVYSLAAVYVQVLLGGIVASNYAGLACHGFPTCNGEWFPQLSGNVAIQVIHRVGAFLVFMKVSLLVLKSVKTRLPSSIKKLTGFAGLLLLVQVSLGIGTVLMGMPVTMNVAHHVVAAALFGTLLVIIYESNRIRLH